MAEILGIGGICVDRLAMVSEIPAWDETTHISTYTMQQGGMVATAMAAAARLGVTAKIIGGIGDDETGQFALHSLQTEHIDVKHVKIFEAQATAFSFVLVNRVSGQRAIIHYKGVQTHSDLEMPAIDLSGVAFLHLDGYWCDTAIQTAHAAKKRGITITLDPSSILLTNPAAHELFSLADYVIPGYSVASRFTGETDPLGAAEAFLKYGAKAVIITLGERGCVLKTVEKSVHFPAFDVPVIDTTGAGDTFHGAFIVGLYHGYDLRQAIQFASAAAALKCTKMGGQAGIPTFDETQEFLAGQEFSSPMM